MEPEKKEKIKHSLKKYLTKKEQEETLKAFRLFDQDGSGSISIREFDQIMKTLGQTLNQEEIQTIVNEVDTDGNGFIEFEQFLELVAPKIISNRSERVYLQAFKIFDQSDDGLINKEELMRANYISKARLSQQQIDNIMEYVSKHFDGKFNFTNVLKMLYRTPYE